MKIWGEIGIFLGAFKDSAVYQPRGSGYPPGRLPRVSRIRQCWKYYYGNGKSNNRIEYKEDLSPIAIRLMHTHGFLPRG